MGKLPAVFGVVLCLATGALPAAAKKKEKKSNPAAVALFEKALAVSDIEAKGSPAFRLQATVRIFGNQNKRTDAVLVQFWAPGDKWREETMMPGYSLVKVFDGQNQWAKATLAYEPFPVYEAWATLDLHKRLGRQIDQKSVAWLSWVELTLTAIRPKRGPDGPRLAKPKRQKGNQECVEDKGDIEFKGMFCFDATSGDLMSEVDRATGIRYEYEDYAAFGQKSFPRLVRVFSSTKKEFLEIHVNRIDPLTQPSPTMFLPGKGSQEEPSPACTKFKPPKISHAVLPAYALSSFGNQISGWVVLYGEIGSNGILQGLWPVRSFSSRMTDLAIQAVKLWRYKPATCESAGPAHPGPVPAFIDIYFGTEL